MTPPAQGAPPARFHQPGEGLCFIQHSIDVLWLRQVLALAARGISAQLLALGNFLNHYRAGFARISLGIRESLTFECSLQYLHFPIRRKHTPVWRRILCNRAVMRDTSSAGAPPARFQPGEGLCFIQHSIDVLWLRQFWLSPPRISERSAGTRKFSQSLSSRLRPDFAGNQGITDFRVQQRDVEIAVVQHHHAVRIDAACAQRGLTCCGAG